ncbi:MAG: NAD(P)/FAD-dependent oxidoreductase, partial [Gemmatimonadales bacterium]|nr:NAD(P)/FAD-dependent oxidoreductase [Gemmatimonadales bacterium]
AGWVPPPIVRELGLTGLELVTPDPTVSVPLGGGEWLSLSPDAGRAAETIRRHSPRDAAAWGPFTATVAKLAGFLEALYVLPPPDIDARTLGELLPLLGVARKLRGLGKRDMVALLRTIPMSVQELLDDTFEHEALKAAVGAGGVLDIRQGPRSGGTAFVLLHHQVGGQAGALRGRGYWKGGPGALVEAATTAARRYGAEIRTGAEVVRISIKDDRVAGVVLTTGEEIAVKAVLSTADPARTLLGMVDPVWLDPEFVLAVRNIKFRGSSSKVLFALESVPPEAHAGALTLAGSLEQIERAADAAKYGRASERPFVELQFPSLRWPHLAPAGRHVAVAHVQFTPFALRDGEWTPAVAEELAARVGRVIEESLPGFAGRVLHRAVLSPVEIAARYFLTEGAVTHGEMTLDQILFMRPVASASKYAAPIEGLYLGGAGSHPGSGIAGAPGWLAAKALLRENAR